METGRSLSLPDWKHSKLSVPLIGFSGDVADRVAKGLDALGCEATAVNSPSDLLRHSAVFVSGDHTNFRAIIREIRRLHAGIIIAVITQIPAVEKWLDGLAAGANDYYNLPLDGRELRSLLGRKLPLPMPN